MYWCDSHHTNSRCIDAIDAIVRAGASVCTSFILYLERHQAGNLRLTHMYSVHKTACMHLATPARPPKMTQHGHRCANNRVRSMELCKIIFTCIDTRDAAYSAHIHQAYKCSRRRLRHVGRTCGVAVTRVSRLSKQPASYSRDTQPTCMFSSSRLSRPPQSVHTREAVYNVSISSNS